MKERRRQELPLESIDRGIKLVDPPEQELGQLDHRLRQARFPFLENPGQLPDPGPALRSDDPVLGQVVPKRVDRLCTLAHQQVMGAKEHPQRLLRLRLDRHEV